jgi:hypothetical protein
VVGMSIGPQLPQGLLGFDGVRAEVMFFYRLRVGASARIGGPPGVS